VQKQFYWKNKSAFIFHPLSFLNQMRISLLKIRQILLCILFFLMMGKVEANGAPAKFYDDLKIEAQKIVNSQKSPITVPIDNTLLLNSDSVNESHKKIPKKKSAHNLNPTTTAVVQPYLVLKNDTLFSISSRFNVAPEQLATWNDINPPYQVYSGQKLKIFKNKQKHSPAKSVKNPRKTAKNVRDNSQKTSIISINNKSMLKLYYHWPTEGKVIKKFSQTGGRGIEIGGKLGQAIKAVAVGKVVAVSPGIYGHGSFVLIQHKDSYLSTYANNQRVLVKNGQLVAQDQVIAEMGQVGHKPPSLEFEIRKNGNLVDPLRVLPKKEK
jgi:lipoprotein NlpD